MYPADRAHRVNLPPRFFLCMRLSTWGTVGFRADGLDKAGNAGPARYDRVRLVPWTEWSVTVAGRKSYRKCGRGLTDCCRIVWLDRMAKEKPQHGHGDSNCDEDGR